MRLACHLAAKSTKPGEEAPEKFFVSLSVLRGSCGFGLACHLAAKGTKSREEASGKFFVSLSVLRGSFRNPQ